MAALRENEVCEISYHPGLYHCRTAPSALTLSVSISSSYPHIISSPLMTDPATAPLMRACLYLFCRRSCGPFSKLPPHLSSLLLIYPPAASCVCAYVCVYMCLRVYMGAAGDLVDPLLQLLPQQKRRAATLRRVPRPSEEEDPLLRERVVAVQVRGSIGLAGETRRRNAAKRLDTRAHDKIARC